MPTVASLSRILAGRCGAAITAASLDGRAESDVWLDPLASAARALGYDLADSTTIDDADVAGLDADGVEAILAVAEVRALETALANYTKVDQTVALGSQKLGQYRTDLEALIARKSADLMRTYGIGVGTLASGTVDLGFAETSDEVCGW